MFHLHIFAREFLPCFPKQTESQWFLFLPLFLFCYWFLFLEKRTRSNFSLPSPLCFKSSTWTHCVSPLPFSFLVSSHCFHPTEVSPPLCCLWHYLPSPFFTYSLVCSWKILYGFNVCKNMSHARIVDHFVYVWILG